MTRIPATNNGSASYGRASTPPPSQWRGSMENLYEPPPRYSSYEPSNFRNYRRLCPTRQDIFCDIWDCFPDALFHLQRANQRLQPALPNLCATGLRTCPCHLHRNQGQKYYLTVKISDRFSIYPN